ncbi:MAG: putative Ig domain-containing protein [Pseudomonadota bacterium]
MNLIPKIIVILILSLLISACTDESQDDTLNTDAANTENKITISGSVGDGPIIGAIINIKNNQSSFLATTTSDDQANYQLEISTQTEDFPLVLEAFNGVDLVTGTTPDFTLVSVILNDSTQQANLNPHSTLIVKTAQLMPGGLTESNLQWATQIVLAKLNFGLDSGLVNDPISTTIDENNVVTITHASEALAEMLRRTSRIIGNPTDVDTILESLAADLTDGALDGLGVNGANPLHTAVSHVVSLQVLLEAMLHDLHVNNVPADDALTAAINTITGTSSEPLPTDGSTNLNTLMLDQAKAALTATQVIDPSAMLENLRKALNEMGDGSTTEDMIAALARYSLDLYITSSLDEAINETALSSSEQIDAINEAANTVVDENTEIDDPIENTIPSIYGIPADSVSESGGYSFTPVANDPDGDLMSFSITSKPAWASFDSTTGTLSGAPGFDDSGNYSNILISVSDGSATASLSAFDITVTNTNRAPLIDGNPSLSVAEGASYSFTPSSSDPDGDTLTFSILNKPSWSNFSTSTGSLTGTPDFGDTNTYSNIVISVSDGSATASLSAFSITVTNTNWPPSISGIPATSVAENSSYSFTPTTSDPDGDILNFNITNQPAWASFNTATGTLSGAPDFDDASTYSNIVISVSDGSATTSLSAFNITVTETNRPPSISGIPANSVTIGDMYQFLPSANDPDGDILNFSVMNLPAWATFDTTSGVITGTPELNDLGLYEDIIISVSDGSAEDSLNSISIMVDEAPITTGSATLSWTIPTTRTDGSYLDPSEIDGYRIYMGPNEDDVSMIVDLNEGGATGYTVMDLAIGTYVFKVSTYDTNGNEGGLSDPAIKDIM